MKNLNIKKQYLNTNSNHCKLNNKQDDYEDLWYEDDEEEDFEPHHKVKKFKESKAR